MSTYVPISTQTLSSSATEIIFTGIPQTYTDLVLVISGRSTLSDNQEDGRMRFNGNANSLYSRIGLFGTGTSPGSDSGSNDTSARFAYWFPAANTSSGIFSATVVNIMNYANTTTNKTVITRQSNQSNVTGLPNTVVNLWRSTTAINQIELFFPIGSWASGSTFTLYGIGAGSPKAFGGDEVRTDGTYWYHIYRSSGVFAPVTALTCDYLVVAGGGGGGVGRAGGGGAGGYRTSVGTSGGGSSAESPLSLVSGTNYTVTIGAGAAAIAGDNNGNNGSNSTFATITSTGGGGGGGYRKNGITGGSGGGAGGDAATTPGSGTANQGTSGGQESTRGGGGGGGAGAAGADAGTNNGGNGGAGLASSISGTSVTRAGGGGAGASGDLGATAGTGGSGGGGNGNATNGATAGSGTVNTGSGGGGADGATGTGGAGGSGTVIVRYLV
jgi:hypothetical protein